MEQTELPFTKDVDAPPVALGDTTNLPQNYDSFASSLWETLTFQRNVNLPFAPANDKALGLSIAMQCAAVKARDIAKAEMYLWRKSGRHRSGGAGRALVLAYARQASERLPLLG